jgi:hypothetical protein
MKIFPPARFESYGIGEQAVQILVNRVFSRIQSLYMFASSEVCLQLIVIGTHG